MVVVVNAVTVAVNTMTVANLSRMRRRGTSGRGYRKSSEEEKRKEPPVLLKEKFEEAWKKQEDRLSKLVTHKDEGSSYSIYGSDYSDIKNIYRYENGEISESYQCLRILCGESTDETFLRYDELGNCIQSDSNRSVYYPNSKQKEFNWTEKDGIKHFDRDGVEDTKVYFAKLHVEKKKEEQLKKLENKPKIQKLVTKIANSTAFKGVAESVAKIKFKKYQSK